MDVRVVDNPGVFEQYNWEAVVNADPDGSIFHTNAFQSLWWNFFGVGDLKVVVGLDADRVVGFCSFEVVQDQLRFLGGFDVTDYMGPCAFPYARDEFAARLLEVVTNDFDWQAADLRGLPEDGYWFGALQAGAGRSGLTIELGSDGVAPFIDLGTEADDYLSSLPSKLRHEIRRKRRKLVDGVGHYSVEFASEGSLSADFDRFIVLHRASQGDKAHFMTDHMEKFFRGLADTFLPAGVFRLCVLRTARSTGACTVGFVHKGRFLLYNASFDREVAELSPGMVLISHMIESSIGEGLTRFDLLKGDYSYKYRLGAVARPIAALKLTPTS